MPSPAPCVYAGGAGQDLRRICNAETAGSSPAAGSFKAMPVQLDRSSTRLVSGRSQFDSGHGLVPGALRAGWRRVVSPGAIPGKRFRGGINGFDSVSTTRLLAESQNPPGYIRRPCGVLSGSRAPGRRGSYARGLSSFGRAPLLQGGGGRFEPDRFHGACSSR